MKDITVLQAARLLELSPRRVQRMIVEEGKFPGAHQIDPDIPNSPYVIPLKEVEVELKKRAQSSSSED